MTKHILKDVNNFKDCFLRKNNVKKNDAHACEYAISDQEVNPSCQAISKYKKENSFNKEAYYVLVAHIRRLQSKKCTIVSRFAKQHYLPGYK